MILHNPCSSDGSDSTRPMSFPPPNDVVTPRSLFALLHAPQILGLYCIALSSRQSIRHHDTCHPPILCAVSCRGRASAGRFSVPLLGLTERRRSQPRSVISRGYLQAHGVC